MAARVGSDEVKEQRFLQITQKVGGVQAVRTDNPLQTVTAHMFQCVALAVWTLKPLI